MSVLAGAAAEPGAATAGPQLVEDDGTLLLVRTATEHPALHAFADVLEEHVSKANEALRFADLITSEQGKAAFSDPSMRARFAQQSQRSLLDMLETLQQQVEKTDNLALTSVGGEVRMARKALVRFAQSTQELLESAKEKVSALLRILGPEAAASAPQAGRDGKRRSRWGAEVEDDAPLQEKYREAFQTSKQQEEEEQKPALQTAREEGKQVAREKAQERKDAAAAGHKADGELKPIVVKYQGRGENPPPTDNLYVKGLPGWTTEEDIEAIFTKVGTVQSQKLKTADWGAICFVRLTNRAEAAAAIERFNGTIPDQLRNRPKLAAAAAAPPTTLPRSGGSDGGSSIGAPAAGEQRSTEAGTRLLQKLTFVRVDLSQPLGAFFNNDCIAQNVGPGTQAARLGIPVGACIKAIEGKSVTKGTEQLVKRIGRAKKKGLREVVLAYSPPPLTAVFSERPFGFMVGLDETQGLFVTGEADGQAKEKGVKPGLALVTVDGAELVGLTIDDCFQCLREAPLPARLVFKPVPKDSLDGSSSLAAATAGGEAVVLSSEDEEDGAGQTAQSTAVKALAAMPRIKAGSVKTLQRIQFVRVDLALPLGIGFDDDCVANKIGDGMQGAKLGITKGAKARIIGGRELTQGTKQLVRRIQKAKYKGFKDILMGFAVAPMAVEFEERPFGITIGVDSVAGLCLIRAVNDVASKKGVKPGIALVAVNGEDLVDMTEADIAQRLRDIALPVLLTFQEVGNADGEGDASGADRMLSSSEDEAPVLPVAPARSVTVKKQPLRKAAEPGMPEPNIKRFKVVSESRSAPAATPALDRLLFVRVALSQPLGIFFDDACTADKIGKGMQAENLGIPKGARACILGGRPLVQKTTQLVKRMKKAKAQGLAEVVMGFVLPSFEAAFDQRPFGFVVALDEGLGFFVVREADGSAAELGVRVGCALTSINGEMLSGMTESEVVQQLNTATLPVRVTFKHLPGHAALTDDLAADGPVVLSEDDDISNDLPAVTATAAKCPDHEARQAVEPDLEQEAWQCAEVPQRTEAPVDLMYVRVDLAKPLGIGFDDACIVEKVNKGTQAEKLGIPQGSCACFAGGRTLAQKTGRLMKVLQKAKKRGLGEIIVGFSLPHLVITFEERPFGFSVDQDEKSGKLFVSFARGAAKEKGVHTDYALVALEGEEVTAMGKADVQQRLRQMPLPAKMAFQTPVADGIGSEAARAGFVISDSEDEHHDQDAGGKRARVEEKSAKVARQARSTRAGMQTLKGLTNFRFDLGKPLGIYFDKECVVEKVFPGSQATELGIPMGGCVRAVGGKQIPSQTDELVKRIGKAKQKGRKAIILGFTLPRLMVKFDKRPLPFSVNLDVEAGLFTVGNAALAAASKGLKSGMALTEIGCEEVVHLTEKDLAQRLDDASLPVECVFQALPIGNQGLPEGGEDGLLSSDEDVQMPDAAR